MRKKKQALPAEQVQGKVELKLTKEKSSNLLVSLIFGAIVIILLAIIIQMRLEVNDKKSKLEELEETVKQYEQMRDNEEYDAAHGKTETASSDTSNTIIFYN